MIDTGAAGAAQPPRFCYGTCCPVHGVCECYAAVEQMDPAADRAMGSCETPNHQRPLFRLVPARAEA